MMMISVALHSAERHLYRYSAIASR